MHFRKFIRGLDIFFNVRWIILDYHHYVTLKFQHFGQQVCTFVFSFATVYCTHTKKVKVNMFYLYRIFLDTNVQALNMHLGELLGAWPLNIRRPLKYEPSKQKGP